MIDKNNKIKVKLVPPQKPQTANPSGNNEEISNSRKNTEKELLRLKQMQEKIELEVKKIEALKEDLRKREEKVKEAELKMQHGFTDERKKLDDDLYEKRKITEKEIAEKRSKALEELASEIETERKRRQEKLDKEFTERFTIEEEKIRNEKAAIKVKEADLENREIILNGKEERIKIEYAGIDEEVKQRTEEWIKYNNEKIASNERLLESARIENNRLRDELNDKIDLEDKLNGTDYKTALMEMETREKKITEYTNERINKFNKEKEDEIDKYKNISSSWELAWKKLKEDYTKLTVQFNECLQDKAIIDSLKIENNTLSANNARLNADNLKLKDEFTKLSNIYGNSDDEETKIKNIEIPYFEEKDIQERNWDRNELNEIDWINNIMKCCLDNRYRFNERLLYAFHTSLKIAEWSPLTVLAGVSGTGKSLLPKLYSHFGGLNFLNVSVQPNWDSQESMLGFYNSINGFFDAQPVLKLLVQSQKEASDTYPGLKDAMTIILLDEMNLAHIELYFAEFLSKLEARRGDSNNKIQYIDVNIGSKKPYKLELGRNVLWTGTMNQDETTKSLSDKVIDRGQIINFPRPKKLERKEKYEPLLAPHPLITKHTWGKWCKPNIDFSDTEINPYLSLTEEINDYLAIVSRALGHRVWQSIEYYMANHPKVIKAKSENNEHDLRTEMKKAFEDQLVQKVMPKLRGIEIRGKSGECLDKIRNKLKDFSIADDFNKACKEDYGQFIWDSSDYLLVDEKNNDN